MNTPCFPAFCSQLAALRRRFTKIAPQATLAQLHQQCSLELPLPQVWHPALKLLMEHL